MKLRELTAALLIFPIVFLVESDAASETFFFRSPSSWGFSFGALARSRPRSAVAGDVKSETPQPPRLFATQAVSKSRTKLSQVQDSTPPAPRENAIAASPSVSPASAEPTAPAASPVPAGSPPQTEDLVSSITDTREPIEGAGEATAFSGPTQAPIDQMTEKPSVPTKAAVAQKPARRRPTAIVFPGQQNANQEVIVSDGFVPECNGIPYMAWNNETEQCQFLMMQTDCADGEWFILDKETRAASCVEKPCVGKQVLFEGTCRERQGLCPEGMEVLVNEYGEAECDCSVKHVYYARTGRCHAAFRQGPCRLGQYLTLGKKGGQCTDNVCFRDGAVFWPGSRRCHRLQDVDDSPCPLGRLDVNVETLALECADTQLNAIFNLPVVRCSPGSKLDYAGKCRQELFQKFRSSLLDSGVRRRGRDCGDGYIKAPSGRCLRASSGSQLG